jgi:hypothetical protein
LVHQETEKSHRNDKYFKEFSRMILMAWCPC